VSKKGDFYRALARAVYEDWGADWLDEALTLAGDVLVAVEDGDPLKAVDCLSDARGRAALRRALADVATSS